MSTSTVLPFGKFRNVPLGEVPLTYLTWVKDNVEWKSEKLRQAVIAELQRRPAEPDEPGAVTRVVTTVSKAEPTCAVCGLAGADRLLVAVHTSCIGEAPPVSSDTPTVPTAAAHAALDF